jgi:hypothetical protein
MQIPRQPIKWILRLTILGLVLFFVRRSLLNGLVEIRSQPWHLDPLWLVLSGAIYLLSLLPAGWFWCRVMGALGQDPRIGETLRAYYVGHLGKYVPGKALVVIMRAGLIGSRRVDAVVAATAVFVETLTMMAVGALLAAAILPLWFHEPTRLVVVTFALVLLAGLPTLPPVFRRLLRLTPKLRLDSARLKQLDGINYRTLAWGWLAMTVGWLVAGFSLWAALRGAGIENLRPWTQWPLYTAAVALATVSGFLSMIPGGFIVRELVLLEVLQPDFGPAGALIGVLLLRVVWLVAELVISGILYVVGPRPSPEEATPPPASAGRIDS